MLKEYGRTALSAIHAVVRNGRFEPIEPITLPEGAEVIVSPVEPAVDTDWDVTPEAIAARLAAMDTIEPLILTDEERAAWDEAQKARKEWEISHWNERAEQIRGLWK